MRANYVAAANTMKLLYIILSIDVRDQHRDDPDVVHDGFLNNLRLTSTIF